MWSKPSMMRHVLQYVPVCGCVLVLTHGCQQKEPQPPEQPEIAEGEVCDPGVERLSAEQLEMEDPDAELPAVCSTGLACEPVADSDEYMCHTALEIRGRVNDSTTGEPVADALVAALNETGEPVTDVVSTDACGEYVLPVSVLRTAEGEYAETPKWTLHVSAQNYLPFPAGLRPALPVDIADAEPDPDPPESETDDGETGDGEVYPADVIDNAATSVALLPLGEDQQGGGIVSGQVDGEGSAGTLVVAEGADARASYAIADASGHYTLFNVPAQEVTIRGYRNGIEVEPNIVTGNGELMESVDLPVINTDPDAMATVSGNLEIVDAPAESETSVVLVPSSVFNEALERGPVPVGLRDPEPPAAPDVTSDFSFSAVPAGTYKILVAFENDHLVRDPDEGIAGTAILELDVAAGEDVTVVDSFKVTAALDVMGPGTDAPEEVEGTPELRWADDASENGFDVTVFDALGNIVWEHEAPSVEGAEVVSLTYGGPELTAGMYYQFRVTSWRDQAGSGRLYISRTEDLRGVFFSGDAPPPPACTVEEEPASE